MRANGLKMSPMKHETHLMIYRLLTYQFSSGARLTH